MGRTILVNVGTSLLTNEPNATYLKEIYDKVKQFLQEFNNNFNEVNLSRKDRPAVKGMLTVRHVSSSNEIFVGIYFLLV